MSDEYLVIDEPSRDACNGEAWTPNLPGCVAIGDTPEGCKRRIAEAVALPIAETDKAGESMPPPATRADLVKVAA